MKIALVCPVGIPLSPDSLKTQSIGGSETALLSIAQALSKNNKVHLYCLTDQIYDRGSLTYLPVNTWLSTSEHYDATVFSRDLSYAASRPPDSKYTAFWMHDMPPTDLSFQGTVGNFWCIDEAFSLSDFHERAWDSRFKNFKEFSHRTRNGLDRDLIEKTLNNKHLKKTPGKVIYTSCPERGLSVLLTTIFPKMLEINPEMRLSVAGYSVPDNILNPSIKTLRKQLNIYCESHPSIDLLGSLKKPQLYEEIATSQLLLYPTDFPEISCITAMEAQALGTPIITTKSFALPETLGENYKGLVASTAKDKDYSDKFIDVYNDVMANYEEVVKEGKENAVKYDWKLIAIEWEKHFDQEIKKKGYNLNIEGSGYLEVKRKEPTVALCMIAKNEENDIKACLESVLPHVNEVRILIAGVSTDRTKEIAARVLGTHQDANIDFIWSIDENDFNEGKDFVFDVARNESISKATSDWVLWMDADERLIKGQNLQKFLRSEVYKGFIIKQHQFAVDMPDSYDEPVRVFKNPRLEGNREIKFYGVIHEHPEYSLNSPVNPVLQLDDVDIAHFGYLSESLRRGKARDRNLELLVKDAQVYPDRLLGKVLMMRDLIHMFEWGLERDTFTLEYLARCLNLYKEYFYMKSNEDFESVVWERAYAFYQKALQYCAQFQAPHNGVLPFAVDMFLSIESGKAPTRSGSPQVRWFLAPEEFEDFMTKLSKISLRRLKMDTNPYEDLR